MLFVRYFFLILLSVPLLYHSMGQIIKSVFVCLCMYVCMYVCICASVGTLTVAFFYRSSRNLVRTFGSESEELIGSGRNPKMLSPILTPKTPKFTTEIGNSQPNIKPMIKDQIFCTHRFYYLFFSFIHLNYFIFA